MQKKKYPKYTLTFRPHKRIYCITCKKVMRCAMCVYKSFWDRVSTVLIWEEEGSHAWSEFKFDLTFVLSLWPISLLGIAFSFCWCKNLNFFWRKIGGMRLWITKWTLMLNQIVGLRILETLATNQFVWKAQECKINVTRNIAGTIKFTLLCLDTWH